MQDIRENEMQELQSVDYVRVISSNNSGIFPVRDFFNQLIDIGEPDINDDFNNLVENGYYSLYYRHSSMNNYPGGYGMLVVFDIGEYTTQLYSRWDTKNLMWRMRYQENWSDWKVISFT